ncbi:MAG: hypothetical protein JXR78_08775 [Victivallales bacterium]|nr:hypothetical protein [Victivallales bacterium]
MLIDGKDNLSAKDRVTEVPICSKTDLLIKEGRNYAEFTMSLAKELEAHTQQPQQETAITKDDSHSRNGMDLLLQLL